MICLIKNKKNKKFQFRKNKKFNQISTKFKINLKFNKKLIIKLLKFNYLKVNERINL